MRSRRARTLHVEGAVFGVGEAAVFVEHAGGFGAGELDELHVGEPRDLEAGEAGLLRAEELAGAAELHVGLGELEAVGRLLHQLEAGARVVAGLVAEQQAVALVGAAADAPAELVELRESEAVGAFDHHHRRVRDVDADFDDGGRDEDVGVAVAEAAHHFVLLLRRHAAVQQLEAQVRVHLPRAAARTPPSPTSRRASPTPRRAGR